MIKRAGAEFRYVRTEGDRRARDAARARRRDSIWKCPGCGARLASRLGLVRHLELDPDIRGCCPSALREWNPDPLVAAALNARGGNP